MHFYQARRVTGSDGPWGASVSVHDQPKQPRASHLTLGSTQSRRGTSDHLTNVGRDARTDDVGVRIMGRDVGFGH